MKNNSSVMDTNDNKLNWVSETISNNYSSFKSVTTSIEGSNTYIYCVGYKNLHDDNSEALITKWDVNGTLVWQKKIGGSSNDYFYSVTISNEGSNVYIYAVGYETSSTSNDEAFITKWDVNGTLLWQKKISGSSSDIFYSVTASNEGSIIYIYAVGYEHSSANNDEAFITKWDTNGTLVWQKKIGGSSNNYFTSVTTSIEENNVYIYAVGYEYLPIYGGYTKTFITKWNTDGTLVWQKKIGESNHDYFTSVTTSIEGSNIYIYIVGYRYLNTSNSEAFITKWNTDGSLVWQKKIDGNNTEQFYSVTTSNEGSNVFIYAIGYRYSNTGISEAFITKWNNDGLLVWQRKINKNKHIKFYSVTTSFEENSIFVYAVGNKSSSTNSKHTKAIITKWNINGNIMPNQLENVAQL